MADEVDDLLAKVHACFVGTFTEECNALFLPIGGISYAKVRADCLAMYHVRPLQQDGVSSEMVADLKFCTIMRPAQRGSLADELRAMSAQ
jgi:hypothetical protein